VAGVTLLALPLLVTPFETLLAQYRSWGSMGSQDHLSVEQAWIGGIVETALGRSIPHAPIQVVGVLWIGLTSWLASRVWGDAVVRRLLLASVLGFSVLFNHKGESPTYVIAFAGAGIWWSVMPRARWRDMVILSLLLVGSLGGSDLFPKSFRQQYYRGWQLKAVMTTVWWMALQWDVMGRLAVARDQQRFREE
jgi:hypothetical protein